MLFCLWAKLFWTVLDDVLLLVNPAGADKVLGDAPEILFFVAWQLIWWWLIAVMSGIVYAFLLDAPLRKAILRLLPSIAVVRVQ